MFPATLFNKLPALNRFWLKDMSRHHFWQYLCELKPLSCISHMQRLVQQAFSVQIPNSKFPLEIHRLMNKTLIRSLLRIHPFNSTKATTCPLREWSCEGMKAPHFPNSIYRAVLCWNWEKKRACPSGMTIPLLLHCDSMWQMLAWGHITTQVM